MHEDRIISEYRVFAEGAVIVFDLDIIIIAGIAVAGILQIGVLSGIGHPAAAGSVDGISGVNVYVQAIPVFRRGFIAIFFGERL
jgi:hypothetical protein